MATTPANDSTFAPLGVGPRTQGWGWGTFAPEGVGPRTQGWGWGTLA
jgi:hypothetical protein